jgi:hypothetical protein
MRANRCLSVLALLLFFSFPARADECTPSAPPKDPTVKTPPAAATAKEVAAGASSMTVARDPVTGALRPLTAEEAHQLLGRRPLAAAEPQVVTLPDGTRMMRLGPDQASLSVVRKNPDGTLTSACAHGTAEAEAFMEATLRPAPAPAPAVREK